MEFKSLTVIVMVIASAATAMAAAFPRPTAHETRVVRQVELGEAVNRTVCPIEVGIDEDPARIPRRIKTVRCAARPLEVCRARAIPDHECCAHTHDRHLMECVELHDKVLVRYPAADATVAFDVAVGCSCMLSRSVEASTIPPAT